MLNLNKPIIKMGNNAWLGVNQSPAKVYNKEHSIECHTDNVQRQGISSKIVNTYSRDSIY